MTERGTGRQALAFLTPLGGAAAPSAGALGWFPLVGAGIGGVLGAAWWGLSTVWPPAVAAAIVVGLDLGLTGMLHLDGLVDSADGLLPHLARDRRLEVMREPTVGAFGVVACAGVLLARWSALFSVRPSVLLLVALWTGSRTFMAVVATAVPYARTGGGLAQAFLGSPRAGRVAAAIGIPGAVVAAVCAGVVAHLPLESGPVALASGTVAALGVVWLARRRVGGYTGDVLGASGVVLETVGLLVAAAKW